MTREEEEGVEIIRKSIQLVASFFALIIERSYMFRCEVVIIRVKR